MEQNDYIKYIFIYKFIYVNPIKKLIIIVGKSYIIWIQKVYFDQ